MMRWIAVMALGAALHGCAKPDVEPPAPSPERAAAEALMGTWMRDQPTDGPADGPDIGLMLESGRGVHLVLHGADHQVTKDLSGSWELTPEGVRLLIENPDAGTADTIVLVRQQAKLQTEDRVFGNPGLVFRRKS